jgi:hypothetical protein
MNCSDGDLGALMQIMVVGLGYRDSIAMMNPFHDAFDNAPFLLETAPFRNVKLEN